MRNIFIFIFLSVAIVSCGGSSGSGGAPGSGTVTTETDAEAARYITVENDLLASINGERTSAGLPTLNRDTGLDLIMLWQVVQMANNENLSHTDENGRGAEERVRYYSGDNSVRCSEIIQWWGGTPAGDIHYQGYFNSPDHHSAYMEEGIFNLGGSENVGIALIDGTGPAGSQYDGSGGSYSGLVICDKGVTLAVNPFEE